MWRYPFGSGGKRVATRPPFLPEATSSSTMVRMKSVGAAAVGGGSSGWAMHRHFIGTGSARSSVGDQQPRGPLNLGFRRQMKGFKRRRVRHGRVQRPHDAHRRIEELESLLLDDRGE